MKLLRGKTSVAIGGGVVKEVFRAILDATLQAIKSFARAKMRSSSA